MLEARTETTTARKRISNKAKVTEPMAVKMSDSKSSANCEDGDNCDVSYRAKENGQDKQLLWNESQAEHRCHRARERLDMEGRSGVLIPGS